MNSEAFDRWYKTTTGKGYGISPLYDWDVGVQCGWHAAESQPVVMPSEEQMENLVRECGLDWDRGFLPSFIEDDTNRYVRLIEAARNWKPEENNP